MILDVFTSKSKVFKISEMEISDAEKFLKYVKMVGDETDYLTFSSEEIVFTIEEEEKVIETFRDNENELILKAENEKGELISALTFRSLDRKRTKHTGEFGVSVIKEYWGYGIGTRMLHVLEEWARTGDIITKINLSVRDDNQRAVKLYENLGYIKEGHRSRAFIVDGNYYGMYLMGKEL